MTAESFFWVFWLKAPFSYSLTQTLILLILNFEGWQRVLKFSKGEVIARDEDLISFHANAFSSSSEASYFRRSVRPSVWARDKDHCWSQKGCLKKITMPVRRKNNDYRFFFARKSSTELTTYRTSSDLWWFHFQKSGSKRVSYHNGS